MLPRTRDELTPWMLQCIARPRPRARADPVSGEFTPFARSNRGSLVLRGRIEQRVCAHRCRGKGYLARGSQDRAARASNLQQRRELVSAPLAQRLAPRDGRGTGQSAPGAFDSTRPTAAGPSGGNHRSARYDLLRPRLDDCGASGREQRSNLSALDGRDPSFRSTRFKAASETLPGAVRSSPIGSPPRLQSTKIPVATRTVLWLRCPRRRGR